MNLSHEILVFGAGCIGRGLLGELATRCGWSLTFVEKSVDLATALVQSGDYTVRLVGPEESTTRVAGYRVLRAEDEPGIAKAIERCEFAATAVGGEQLPSVAPLIAPSLRGRASPLNILVCENWPRADRVLRDALLRAGAPDGQVTCVPASVERMFRRARGSLDLIGESLGTVYVDASRWHGAFPGLAGLVACGDLAPYYARKLFTSNAGHAVLAYEGYLAGYELLYDALGDGAIRNRVEAVLGLAAEMLPIEYGLDRASLGEHVQMLLRHRYANRELADTVRRVARDPLRKLGSEERLVGLLRRLQKHRLPIRPVCRAIAAALHYRDVNDRESQRLDCIIGEGGFGRVLEEICRMPPEDEAYRLCMAQAEEISCQQRTAVHPTTD